MDTLGNGVNEVWVYSRGGLIPVAPLQNVSSVQWDRVLNDVSYANVTVSTGQHADCCSVLGQIGTWGHELVVFRDGLRVWEGPITNIRWSRGSVSLQAQDVLAYSKRRSTAAVSELTPVYVVDQGALAVSRTFNLGADPNVLAHMQVFGSGTGPQITREVGAYSTYQYDELTEMSKAGLMWTVVGRSVLLWPNTYVIGQTANLIPAEHMSGEVELEEDGMELSTTSIFTNDDGGAGSSSTALDPFYGRVEMLERSDAVDNPSLAAEAETHHAQHYPAPLSVNVPQGSVLSCDSPFPTESLVAGVLVPLRVGSGLCKQVTATQQLQNVSVTQDNGGEQVAITVGPITTDLDAGVS